MVKKHTKPCIVCGGHKKLTEFAKNHNNKDEYDNVCSKCRKKMVIDEESLKEYCRISNRGYNPNLFKDSYDKAVKKMDIKYQDKSDKSNYNKEVMKYTIGYYFRRMNFTQEQKNVYVEREDPKDIISAKADKNFKVTDEMIAQWGSGLHINDYKFLQDEYDKLVSVYAHDTPIQRMIYEEIAITRLEANKARRDGKINIYKDLMRTLRDLMTDANIKPVQETGDHEGLATWGEWVRKIEEEEPIPEPCEEFKDVDGIKKYINKWFVGHFSKIFGINSNPEYEKDYKVDLSTGDD